MVLRDDGGPLTSEAIAEKNQRSLRIGESESVGSERLVEEYPEEARQHTIRADTPWTVRAS